MVYRGGAMFMPKERGRKEGKRRGGTSEVR